MPARLFRHTRTQLRHTRARRGACPWLEQGYLAVNSTQPPSQPSRPSATPAATSSYPHPAPSYPRLLTSVIPALAAEPGPGLNRGISPRTAPNPLRNPAAPLRHLRALSATPVATSAIPAPTSVIPALAHFRHTRACRGYLAANSTQPPSRPSRPSVTRRHLRHTRAHLRHTRTRPSVAPNLIWGPNGGCRRHSAPRCPANRVAGQFGTLALRTALGLGPRSSLGRRILRTDIGRRCGADSRSGTGMTDRDGLAVPCANRAPTAGSSAPAGA